MATNRVFVVSRRLRFPLPRVEEILFGVHGFCFDFLSRWAVGRAPCGLDLVYCPHEICMGSNMALGWEMDLVRVVAACRPDGLDPGAERHEPEGREPYLPYPTPMR